MVICMDIVLFIHVQSCTIPSPNSNAPHLDYTMLFIISVQVGCRLMWIMMTLNFLDKLHFSWTKISDILSFHTVSSTSRGRCTKAFNVFDAALVRIVEQIKQQHRNNGKRLILAIFHHVVSVFHYMHQYVWLT